MILLEGLLYLYLAVGVAQLYTTGNQEYDAEAAPVRHQEQITKDGATLFWLLSIGAWINVIMTMLMVVSNILPTLLLLSSPTRTTSYKGDASKQNSGLSLWKQSKKLRKALLTLRDTDGSIMGTSLIPSLTYVLLLHVGFAQSSFHQQTPPPPPPPSSSSSEFVVWNAPHFYYYYIASGIIPHVTFACLRMFQKTLGSTELSKWDWFLICMSPWLFYVTVFVLTSSYSRSSSSSSLNHVIAIPGTLLVMSLIHWNLTCQIFVPTNNNNNNNNKTTKDDAITTTKMYTCSTINGTQSNGNASTTIQTNGNNTITITPQSLLPTQQQQCHIHNLQQPYKNEYPTSIIFRPGEWLVVGSILHIIVTDFVLRYFVLNLSSSSSSGRCTVYGDDVMNDSCVADGGYHDESSRSGNSIIYNNNNNNNDLSIVLAVSHGGMFGCFMGCTMAYYVSHMLKGKWWRSHINTNHNKYVCSTIVLLVQLLIICLAGFGCVEYVLRYHLEHYQVVSSSLSIPSLYCYHWIITFLGKPCSWNGNTKQWMWIGYWCVVVVCMMPFAIWLAIPPQNCNNDNDTIEPSKQQQSQSQELCRCPQDAQKRPQQGTNGFITMSLRKSSTTMIAKQQHWINKRQKVILGRKYFHVMALLLFVPVTLLSQSLMVLAYAVALCLLFVLELVRVSAIGSRHPSSISDCRSTTDTMICNGDNARHVATTATIVDETNINEIITAETTTTSEETQQEQRRSSHNHQVARRRRTCFRLNDFYRAFMDEKDHERSQEGGVVITHAALILGCAMPLWMYAFLMTTNTTNHDDVVVVSSSSSSNSSPINNNSGMIHWFLPLIGTIVLGIGDACGAVVGVLMGSHKWPGSKRTIEGSFAMYMGMILVVKVVLMMAIATQPSWSSSWMPLLGRTTDGHNGDGWNSSTTTTTSVTFKDGGGFLTAQQIIFVALTLLEASTDQIDNLCLPFYGMTLILMLSVSTTVGQATT